MRFASFVRPLPRLPRLPAPKPSSQDIAKALTEVLQNQVAIMNDIAQIKNTILWLNGQTFSGILEIAPDNQAGQVYQTLLIVNAQLAQALAD